MRDLKNILITASLAIISSCSQNNKTNEYEGLDYLEICEEFDELAFEQKALLDSIRLKYRGDQLFINRFNREQINWIQYQDKRLRALYSKDWDRHYRKEYGKPAFNGCKCKELIRLSKFRNADLRTYLNGPNVNQQDCPIQGNQ
ncbi:MAG: hypothetical protein AAGF85_10665 [Bacteroidota bacterium]